MFHFYSELNVTFTCYADVKIRTVRNIERLELLAKVAKENKLRYFQQCFATRRRSDILNSLISALLHEPSRQQRC